MVMEGNFLNSINLSLPYNQGQLVVAHIYHVLSSSETIKSCFVTLKTEQDANNKITSKAITRTSSPSTVPFFNETLYLPIPKYSYQALLDSPINADNSIVLSVADNMSKSILARFTIALKNIISNRQLHLQLSCQGGSSKQNTIFLRLSLTLIDMANASLSALALTYPLDSILFECIIDSMTISAASDFGGMQSEGLKSLTNTETLVLVKFVKSVSKYEEACSKEDFDEKTKKFVPSKRHTSKPLILDFEANNGKTFALERGHLKSFLPLDREDILNGEDGEHEQFFQMTRWSDPHHGEDMPSWKQHLVLSFQNDEYHEDFGLVFEIYTRVAASNEKESLIRSLEYRGFGSIAFSKLKQRIMSVSEYNDYSHGPSSPLSLKVPLKFLPNFSVSSCINLNTLLSLPIEMESLILGRKEIEPFDPFFVANSNNRSLNSSSIEAPTESSSEKIPVIEKLTSVSESEKIRQLNKSHDEEMERLKETVSTLEQQILDENVDSMSLEEIKQRYMKVSHQSRQQLFTNQQLEGKLRNYHELVLQKTEVEKKYLELQHKYRTLQRKMATLEDKSKEVEFLKSHVLQQESVMKQLQLMIATGSISGLPAKSWGSSGKVFPTNPKIETSESGGDMAKRLDKLETLIEKLLFKDSTMITKEEEEGSHPDDKFIT